MWLFTSVADRVRAALRMLMPASFLTTVPSSACVDSALTNVLAASDVDDAAEEYDDSFVPNGEGAEEDIPDEDFLCFLYFT